MHACIHRACLVRVQIGVFSRVALAAGAARVLALEPEPANAALWRQNCDGCAPRAALLEAAVVHGAPAGGGGATLVYGKPRTDGVQNTWRHALRGLSHYREQGPLQEGGSSSGMTADELGQCKAVVRDLRKHKDAQDFLEPVDWKALGIKDYPMIIKRPTSTRKSLGRLHS